MVNGLCSSPEFSKNTREREKQRSGEAELWEKGREKVPEATKGQGPLGNSATAPLGAVGDLATMARWPTGAPKTSVHKEKEGKTKNTEGDKKEKLKAQKMG